MASDNTFICFVLFLNINFIETVMVEHDTYESLTADLPDLQPRPDGPRCAARNVSGVCVDYTLCPTMEHDLIIKEPPLTCGFRGLTPIVCCDACVLYTDEYALKKATFYEEHTSVTGIKHLDYCKRSFWNHRYKCKRTSGMVFHINKYYNHESQCYHMSYGEASPAGGEDAMEGEYPHMALLGYGASVESAEWRCGGSLITDQYVLTAAHCSSHRDLGPVRYVGVGMLRRTDPDRKWQRLEIDTFISHPDYHSPSKYNDIGLIKTKTDVKFNLYIRPACLSAKDLERPGLQAYATGWGGLGHNMENADTLQAVKLDRFTEEECSSLYGPHRLLARGYNHSTQMCYGSRDQIRDTCGGDSGGPLQVREPGVNCVWKIIGVTSYGHPCGFAGGAGIYTRLKPYIPWIESIVWP